MSKPDIGSLADVVWVLENEMDQLELQQSKARSIAADLKLQDRWIALDKAVKFIRNLDRLEKM